LLSLFILQQPRECISDSSNRTREAPVPTAERIQCKQMDCWRKKKFTILQVDDKSEAQRDEWRSLRWNLSNLHVTTLASWYTKAYADRHGLSYILHSVTGQPSPAEDTIAKKHAWIDITYRFYMKVFVAVPATNRLPAAGGC